jgi:hypothetical protein
MDFIVGVQVYRKDGPNGDSPLIFASYSVNWVEPDEGEMLTVDEMARLALQIHADAEKKATGKEIRIVDSFRAGEKEK